MPCAPRKRAGEKICFHLPQRYPSILCTHDVVREASGLIVEKPRGIELKRNQIMNIRSRKGGRRDGDDD